MKQDITLKVLFVIVLIATLGQVVGCLYTPSFSAIANAFNTPVSEVQFTFSVYLLSFGLSHLFYGPVSDVTGRKVPLILGIAFCALGCLLCYYANNITHLLLGRFIQGAGAGVCGAVGRSVTRDLVEGDNLAHLNSRVGMWSALTLALAPVIGGYMQEYIGWRFSFIFLFWYVVAVILCIALLLPETHGEEKRNDFSMKTMLNSYDCLLRSKTFLGFTLTSCFAYAGFVAFVTASPVLLINTLNLSYVEFGWLAFAIGASFFMAAYINSKLILKHGIRNMLYFGILSMLVIVAGLTYIANTSYHFVHAGLLLVFCVSAGFAFVNAFAGAMHCFPGIAGAAGGLFGTLQTLSGAASAGIISAFHADTVLRLSMFLLTLAVLTYISFTLIIPKDIEGYEHSK